MLKSKKMLLSALFSTGIFCVATSNAIAQSAEGGTVFNYLTIAELLAIDNEIALENEREAAEKFGLNTFKSLKTLEKERREQVAAAQAKEKEEAEKRRQKEEGGEMVIELEGTPLNASGEASPFRGNTMLESLKEDNVNIASSRLIGIYGVDGVLSALVEYEGELYRFRKGQKKPMMRTKQNTLTLVDIQNNCVKVENKREQTQLEYCL